MFKISEVIQYLEQITEGWHLLPPSGKQKGKLNMGYFQEASEREVIISFDDGSDMANLYTANKVWIRKMDKLVEEHPESFKFRRQETYKGEVIAKDYTFPKRFVSIRTKDIERTITDEQRKRASDRMRAMRASHNTVSVL